MNLKWSLKINGRAVQSGTSPLSAKPRAKETVSLKLTMPGDSAANVCALDLVCVDEAGRNIVERSIRLDADGTSMASKLFANLPANGGLKVEQSEKSGRVVHKDFAVNLNRANGEIEIRSTSGALLAGGFFPHTGRRFTMAEELRVARARRDATESDLRNGSSSLWTESFLRPSEVKLAEATKTANGARVVVQAKYDRPSATNQYFTGEVALEVSPSGSINVSYAFKPVNTEGQLLEVGLSMIAPESATEFRWLGAGPFAGYPGKDALNEFGLHHLTSGDLRFQGNRRDVDLALLTSKAGAGVLVGGTNMDVAVENVAGGILFNHNARVSGRGNKGGAPEVKIKAPSLKRLNGEFTLVPLAAEWPASLRRWFGSTAHTAEMQKTFYRSYDQ
jgi:beta-galactosidase